MKKKLSPHLLRHAFATHLLEDERAYQNDELELHGTLAERRAPERFRQWLLG